jgi:hypothetical protein
LLRPVIVGFNATGTPTALEFPAWPAMTALVFKLTHSNWYGWANFVSLIFFASCLWPFLQLARTYVGERTAWWALAFFLAEPLVFFKAGEGGKDGFCLAISIWFLFFAHKMMRTGNVLWWLAAIFAGALSAVSSLPYFLAAALCSILMLAFLSPIKEETGSLSTTSANAAKPLRAWLLLAGAGAVAAGMLALWTRHANALAAQAEFPYTELRLSKSPFMVFWFFGDLHYRLSPGPWLKGAWRFLHATMGALPMVVLLIVGFFSRGNRLGNLWLLATFLTTLVFTHLVLAHWGYYLM